MRKLTVLFFVLTACDYEIVATHAIDDSHATTAAIAKDDDHTRGDAGTTPAPSFGSWQLVRIDSDEERFVDPPFVVIDLRADGRAVLWSCSVGPSDDRGRCGPGARQTCVDGEASIDEGQLHVHLATTEGASLAEAAVTEDAEAGELYLDGTGVLPARGHYRRVTEVHAEDCRR